MSDSVNYRQTELTAKQLKAIPAILAARTVTDGCRAAKISRETFYAWLQEPAFKAEYMRQTGAMIDTARESLRSIAGQAVEVLRKLLSSDQDSVRLRAAQSIIEATLNLKRDQAVSGTLVIQVKGQEKKANQ
ncbi:MAG: hypothetical protein M0Z75_08570 [Nitrospiraceae bacterium]|nr:hypothetical protein [Nitrospiraceae bacterium]